MWERSRQRSRMSTTSFVRCRSRSRTREIASKCWCPSQRSRSWSPPWRKNGMPSWRCTNRSPSTASWIPLARRLAKNRPRLRWTRLRLILRNYKKTTSSSTRQHLPPTIERRGGQSMCPRGDLANLTEWLTKRPIHATSDSHKRPVEQAYKRREATE